MTKFRIISIVFSILVLASFNSCDDDDVFSSTNNAIVGPGTVQTRINAIANLSSLQAALGVATGDIPTTLNGTGPFTVFAPTDAAFTDFAKAVGFNDTLDEDGGVISTAAQNLLGTVDAGLLAQILTYHVVPDNLNAASFSDGTSITTVQGGDLSVTVTDDGVQLLDASGIPQTNPVSNITLADVFADNGFVHLIDKVLLPQEAVDALNFDTRPTLVEWATGTDDLSSLVAALGKAELVDAVTAIDTARVLAPNNQAFEDLFAILGDDYNDIDDFENDVEIALLGEILTYHILPPVDGSTDLTVGSATTLLEDNFIDVAAGFTFGDATATTANTITADLEAKNGFVDIIDKVLLPQSALDFLALLASDDLAATVIGSAELSILEEALIATDLVDAFVDVTNAAMDSTATNFTYFRPATVFAPSDAAFTELFDILGDDYTSIASFDTEDELELLSDILLYHVLAGKVTSDDLEAGMVTTASGSDIEIISVIGSNNFVIGDATNDVNANITTLDVLARNGVAHIIDKVLLPKSAIDFINSLN